MTLEQQREQWLKRILPALAVLVAYFAVGSGFVTEKSKKAEEQYNAMVGKGIDKAALPGLEQQQSQIKANIAKLEQEDKSIHQSLAKSSGFFSDPGSANGAIDRLTVILAEHDLQVLEEIPSEQLDQENLSKSLRETRHWLKDMLAPTPAADQAGNATAKPGAGEAKLNIRKIRFAGGYPDTYRAIAALAASNIKVLPVSLTMKPYGDNTGKQEWVLKLWL